MPGTYLNLHDFEGDILEVNVEKDHFMSDQGRVYAGRHIIVDCYGAHHLDDIAFTEALMGQMVAVSGATLLHIHCHHFTPYGGISGVAVLAESHISCHTWPERQFAAWDIFMCGIAKPELAIDVLSQALQPKRLVQQVIKRGEQIDEVVL